MSGEHERPTESMRPRLTEPTGAAMPAPEPRSTSEPTTLRSHEFFADGEPAGPFVPRAEAPKPVTLSTAAPPPSAPGVRAEELERIVVPSTSPAWIATGLVIVLGSFASAALFMQLREERSARVDAEKTQAAALAAAQEAGRADVARARADAAERDVRIKILERDLGTLAEEKKAQEVELARLKAMEQELAARVSSEIIAGDIRLINQGSRLSVDLVDKLLFNSGEAEVTPRGKEVLSRLGTVLVKLDDRNVQIVGHTDDAPPRGKVAAQFPTNWELSVARAANVVRYLQEEAKVPGKRLIAIGRGQHQPAATNVNAKGRARNRRIEILLTPLNEKLAPPASAPR